VGLDGKRLNRLDCARETGLSTSVVNRQFAALARLGYIQVKRDGSIWYRGKVEPRAEAAVRQTVAECLQGPRNRSTAPTQPALHRLVTERVIPASMLKATQSFPANDQAAVVGGGEKGGQFGGQEGTTCVVTPWTWTAWPGPLIVVWLPCGNFRCPTATAPFFDATAGVLMIFEVHA
jgi:hypothetical protein